MKTMLNLFTVSLIFGVTASSAGGATLANGSFELPGVVPPVTQLYLAPGDIRLTGWTIGGTGGPISLIRGQSPDADLDFPPVEGDYHLSFNGGDNPAGTYIVQAFNTVIGDLYEVAFSVGRIGTNAGAVQLTASAKSDAAVVLTNFTAIPPTHGYRRQRFTFRAISSRSTLEFRDTSSDTDGTDVMLDAVSVESLHAVAAIEVSAVQVCWQSRSNIVYQVQYRSVFDSNTWSNLSTPVQGNGGRICIEVATAGESRKFYRVVPVAIILL